MLLLSARMALWKEMAAQATVSQSQMTDVHMAN
jgi:hypothetical protein